MTTLHEAAALASRESGLVVVATLRANGTIQSSLVNAGVLAHPATGEDVLTTRVGRRRSRRPGWACPR